MLVFYFFGAVPIYIYCASVTRVRAKFFLTVSVFIRFCFEETKFSDIRRFLVKNEIFRIMKNFHIFS